MICWFLAREASITFKPCINEFVYYKPIVQVDGTYLYRKYTRTLLLVVAQDGNDHIILIAFIIVEGDTTNVWFFFLKNLRRYFTP
uniref:MULE transposase domain-containing protein n=1 Tax=Cajanus cajan TaxID=3821 RepID=A0A151SIP6_CAJCA|nr:hypothetical protein KK1_000830 [Cajanus cajan]